jgi:ribose/xylose/arabinose/galactoside ABC-type transport system permease subunit
MAEEKQRLPQENTAEQPAKPQNLLKKILGLLKSQAALLMLIALILIGSLTSDVFLTPQNMLNILWSVSVLGILSIGQTLLLITGNFDMSVAYIIGLAGIVTVMSQIAGAGLFLSIFLGLLAGALVGLLNGLVVVLTKANPFLITLGTSALVYSINLTITQSKTKYATIPAFNILGRGKLFDTLHYSVIIFFVLAIVFEIILRKTKFGQSLYIAGLNERAGKLSGLNLDRLKLIAYIAAGSLAALSGLVMTSRTNSTVANAGVGMEFESLIASVLGGTSLFGGKGGTLRTITGVLVLGVLNNLLILLNIPYEAQQIAKGFVFILVVFADAAFQKKL